MTTVEPWTRQRLLVVLSVVATVFVGLAAGLVYALSAFSDFDSSPTSSAPPAEAHARSTRDAIAAKPMEHAGEHADTSPEPAALHPNEPIRIPQSTTVGAAGVGSGFPRTPEGAIGQLAAIDSVALQPLSQRRARAVFEAWSAPGAVYANWYIAETIQVFQTRTGTRDGDPSVHMTLTPVAAQVKGTDGPRWVLACVQFDMRITYRAEGRIGFGHCERMEWVNGRWRIDGGEVSVQGPATWPGSQRSAEAGWRPWNEPERR